MGPCIIRTMVIHVRWREVRHIKQGLICASFSSQGRLGFQLASWKRYTFTIRCAVGRMTVSSMAGTQLILFLLSC